MTSRQVVVMGVSGTGKTVIGQAVAERLGVAFVEGDAHHPQANIDKMASGTPLDDDDRRPWLEELAAILDVHRRRGEGVVLACSALKRSYRDILRGDGGPVGTFFVHLDLPFDVLHERMEQRDHFMPASLLQSQVDTLEPLADEERGAVLDEDVPVEQVAEAAVAAIERRRRS